MKMRRRNNVTLDGIFSNDKFMGCSHSDINTVELGKETIKEDDRATLLEGGLTRSASAKSQSLSIKTNLIRLLYV